MRHVLLIAAMLAGCVDAEEGELAELTPATAGKADDATGALLLRQGRVPDRIGLHCTYEGLDDKHAGCAIQFTLAPIPYTQRLMGNRLRGKTDKDLPMAVVHEYVRDEPFGPISWRAELRVADGSAPVVGALDDGTPVMFTGDQVRLVLPAESMAVLRLQMESAFWYNSVDFTYRAVFTPVDAVP